MTAALDINLDRSEFSMLDTEGGHWLKYAVPDVLSALWHSQRNPSLTSEQQQTIFDSRLDGMEIFTPEARISCLLFKLTVEISMMMHVLAMGLEVNTDQLDKLRWQCVQEVKRTNGSITFKETLEKNQGEV